MIEKLKESRGISFGFKVSGALTTEDIAALAAELDPFITHQRHPVGILADLREMHGATWAARWHEMRFLQAHTDRIARLAIVSDDSWLEFSEMVLVATAALQAETRYFHSAELEHAWHWVRMSRLAEEVPVRVVPGRGLFKDYTPEYMGIGV
jgi:hypothetical protein